MLDLTEVDPDEEEGGEVDGSVEDIDSNELKDDDDEVIEDVDSNDEYKDAEDA